MRLPSEGRGGRPQRPPARLLKLHRHSLTTLLVIGGQAEDRRAVALSFHRTSPLRQGPFVHLDCGRDELRLASALQASVAQITASPGADPVRSAWGGTLFLDGIAKLSQASQRLLLYLSHRSLGGSGNPEGGWPIRLAVGNAESLATEIEGSRFLPELGDELDKIHVSLGAQPLVSSVA
jgi:DNA-binding NtrC family response regulator